MYKYEIIVFWSKEDERFIAEVPELAGCMAEHNTLASKHLSYELSAMSLPAFPLPSFLAFEL